MSATCTRIGSLASAVTFLMMSLSVTMPVALPRSKTMRLSLSVALISLAASLTGVLSVVSGTSVVIRSRTRGMARTGSLTVMKRFEGSSILLC